MAAPPRAADELGQGCLRFAAFEFHVGRGELVRDGRPVKLKPQATRVLTLLLEHAGELVAHDLIRTRVWPDTFVDFEQGVHNAVRQIRAALDDPADAPRFVETVPRRGYRFIAAVQPLAENRRSASVQPARRWAVGLGLAVALGGVALLTRPATPRPPEAYLAARHLLAQGNADAARRALPLLAEALAEAPELAAIHAALATACLAAPTPEQVAQARVAVARALELDPDLAEAHARAGDLAFYFDLDRPAAARAYRRAVELAPREATVLLAAAHAHASVGDHEAARRLGERARELDPVSALVAGDLAYLHFWAGRTSEALAAGERVLALDPNSAVGRALVVDSLLAQGREAAALPGVLASARRAGASERQLEELAWTPRGGLEGAYLRLQRDRLELRRTAGERVRPEDLAILHARLGQVDRAFELLEEALKSRAPYLLFLEVDPHLANLHTDPRFADLVARIDRRSGRN